MYTNIEEVEPIVSEFYTTEVRNEPTGNQVEEQYTYVDEAGDEQQGVKLVDEYIDNTYVVEVVKPAFESLSRLSMIVDKNSLNASKRPFINTATQAYLDSLQWAWFESYKEWLELEPVEPEKAKDEDGKFIADDEATETNEHYIGGKSHAELLADWELDEPQRPLVQSVSEYQVANFDFFRRYAGSSVQDEMRYDDAVNGTNKWIEHNQAVKVNWPKSV